MLREIESRTENFIRILITIHVHKLDNSLWLGFPSALIIENVRSLVEFTYSHDSWIDNQNIITKHEWGIWYIDHLDSDTKVA